MEAMVDVPELDTRFADPPFLSFLWFTRNRIAQWSYGAVLGRAEEGLRDFFVFVEFLFSPSTVAIRNTGRRAKHQKKSGVWIHSTLPTSGKFGFW